MRKNIQIMARSFSSKNTQLEISSEFIKVRKPSSSIPTRHFEFEPFKFSIER